jgi:hypothetical protein
MRRQLPAIVLVGCLAGGLSVSFHAAVSGAPAIAQPATADPPDAAPAASSPSTPASPAAAAPAPATSTDRAAQVVEQDPIDFFQRLYTSVRSGQYWYAFGLFLCLAVLGLRYASSEFSWMRSDPGGVAVVATMVMLSIIALSATAREPPTWSLFVEAFRGGLDSMGGYVGVKKLVLPAWRKLRGKVGG